MAINPNFVSPCGLYCGVCGIHYATRDHNEKFMEKLVSFYKGQMPGMDELMTKDLYCQGCLSDQPNVFCGSCAIRDCTRNKGYEGCHECEDWPCAHLEDFPVPVGKKVIMRVIPYWREHGTEKFVADEEARYLCPECGHQLFRGARRCNRCKVKVDLD